MVVFAAVHPRNHRLSQLTPLLLPPLLLAACWVQVVVACLLTQMNYLNKALDLFNTAIVSPIYYVMFTLLTIIATVIMFQVGAWIISAWLAWRGDWGLEIGQCLQAA